MTLEEFARESCDALEAASPEERREVFASGAGVRVALLVSHLKCERSNPTLDALYCPDDPWRNPLVHLAMRQLFEFARKVTGGTPTDAVERRASMTLSALLAEAHAAGVSYPRLARMLGVSVSGVRFRLARHGYRTLPPTMSEVAYRGVQSVHLRRRAHCGRGHPFDDENTYVYRGQRHCRACQQMRDRKRHEKARAARP